MKKNILVISQYFYPEPFRINDICREWVKRGYQVTVLTGIPNYPEGKFYKGYGLFKRRRESWDGTEIIRIPLIARGHTAIGMLLNYTSFVVSGFFWSHFTKLRADLVFTYEVSPMTQALIGVWYSKRRKIPNYLYVQDLWPENVEIVGGVKNRTVLRLIDKMVRYIYRYCQTIFATSQSFVERIREKVEETEKVRYWPQYAEDFYRPLERESIAEVPQDGRFKIVFTGNIGFAQGLDILPKTAAVLKEQGTDDICFVIVGDGRYREQLMRETEELQVSDLFYFVDRQPPEKIPSILAACDAAFISFMDNSLFEMTIPAKLQSYMACGMPIIAAASGETQRIIEEAKCGICAPIADDRQLAQAVEDVKNMHHLEIMRHNSVRYYTEHFDKDKVMNEMVLFLESSDRNSLCEISS